MLTPSRSLARSPHIFRVTRQRTIAVLAGLLVIGLVPVAKAAVGPAPDPRVGAARDSEPVVLQGSSFAEWAEPAEVTAKAPSVA
ncbi:MAG: hypothetical protein QOG87_273, partial [Actinomycetota bacterium]